ncbi:MAG TPA: hypothetical protein VFT42_06430 [Solirubrobacteraceae bacterium]|nr:hypothetical protein [Solirubrobacteraceae bacterium]
MRRVLMAVGLSIGVLGVAASPALATFHLEKVNEVMLASASGDASVQFVELLDTGGSEEQFTPVFAPYQLVVYDAAGNKLGSHMLDPNGLRAAAATGTPYLVSTAAADAAFGVQGDERLDVALPLAAGQACFEANPTPPAFSCLTWGAITKPVPTNSMGTGSANGPVPPNGESDQRQPDNTIVAAQPTPKAPNSAAAPAPTPAPGQAMAAFTGVRIAGRTARVDRRGRAGIRLRCPAGTDGACSGRLVLTTARGAARIGSTRFVVAAAKSATVAVRLTRAALRRLARDGRLAVHVRAVARDAAGTAVTTRATRFTLTMRRRR